VPGRRIAPSSRSEESACRREQGCKRDLDRDVSALLALPSIAITFDRSNRRCATLDREDYDVELDRF
jgi:hypothetical protein